MPGALVEFLIGFLFLLPFFFLASLNHDRLVRMLYEKYRPEWRQAGGPFGFFWRAPGERPSMAGFIRASVTWAFRLPPKLAADPASRRPLLLLRVGIGIWNLGMIALFALLISRHGPPSTW